jgi:superfamily II DNA or RNA helicase
VARKKKKKKKKKKKMKVYYPKCCPLHPKMAQNQLRYYQQEALDAMNALPDGDIGCVIMACGTGKTLIVKNFVYNHGPGLTIIVFPRLALIEQYTRCYTGAEDQNVIRYITVGSIGLSAKRNKNIIRRLINQGHEGREHVVILTTYISIAFLTDTLEGYDVDNIIYDESHHTNTELQDDVFSVIKPNRTFYFTATPVSNHFNIIIIVEYGFFFGRIIFFSPSRFAVFSFYSSGLLPNQNI